VATYATPRQAHIATNTSTRGIIIICYIYIALFWVLDDAFGAIFHLNAHHTPAYWSRGDGVMKPISIYGDDWEAIMMGRGQGWMPGLHPLSFSKDILGFFL